MAKDREIFVITGLEETLTALKKFDKDAVSRFNKVVNTEIGKAKFKAVETVPLSPMSGWREEAFGPQQERKTFTDKQGRKVSQMPKWNPTKAKAGIRVSKAQRRVRGDYTTNAGALIQGDAAGAIFEVAGRKGATGNQGRSRNPNAGTQFKANLTRFSRASRLVWKAVDSYGDEARREVEKALNEAKRILQEHLSKQKG